MAALAMVLDNIMGCVNTVFYKNLDIAEEALKGHEELVVPLLRCQECASNYCDDRVPRSLLCGHSLCTPCVEAMFANEKSCPECREKQQSKTIDSVPVNYQLLRLTRIWKREEIRVGSRNRSLLFADVSKLPIKDELWKCNVHDSPKVLFCRSCNVWICENCLVLDHRCPPRGTCRLFHRTDAIDQMRRKYEEVAANIQKDIETMKADFELNLGMHDFCLQHCKEERGHLRLVKGLEPLLLGKREANNLKVKRVKWYLKNMIDSLYATYLPEEVTMSCKELLQFQMDSKTIITNQKERLASLRPSIVEHFNMEIKKLAEGKVPIYATLQEDGISRWTRLCLAEEQLLLYSLQEGTPPSDGLTIPYKYMERLMEEDSRTLFLEVEAEGEPVSGRVFVKLEQENALRHQMFLMCTGRKGVSFRNTRFFEEEEGSLSGGAYQKSDGSGGGTIVPGLGELYEPTPPPRVLRAGIVLGYTSSTRFHIIVRQHKSSLVNVLGVITRGLPVVRDAAKLKPASKAFIKDCGVLIKMKRGNDYTEGLCFTRIIDPEQTHPPLTNQINQ